MNINLTLIMQAVAFAAFIWFTAKFVWPPLMGAIDTRQKQIADGLAAGEQGRQELASTEKRIRDADRGQGARRRRSSRRREVAQPRRSTQRRARRRPRRTASSPRRSAEIEQEVARAKEQLRDQVADLAVAGAEKILQREVDPKAHAELLGDRSSLA